MRRPLCRKPKADAARRFADARKTGLSCGRRGGALRGTPRKALLGLLSSAARPPSGTPGSAGRAAPAAKMDYDWLGFGYAALIASGGVIGYAKAGSVPSLAAGLLFGGLAGLGAYQQSKDPKNVWLSLVASGTLATVMGMRFYNSRKAMPGLIAVASLFMVGRLGLQIMEKPLKP
ncbi:transmembrane protein 14C-like [Dromaius novaehollandiae]